MKGFLEETGSLIKDFWYFLINYIFLIWAHSPIIPLTSDTNFPNLQFPEENNNIRLSLFSFYFGEYAFYFMSWSFSEKNFRLIKKLSLSSLKAFNTDDDSPEFKQKINDFRNHISSLNSADICIEKEALCRKIENDNARINKSDLKLNIYSTIVLAIISIINFKTFISFSFDFSIKNILILLNIYYFTNICAIIIQNIKVKGFLTSKIKDLETAQQKDKFYLEQLYYDSYFISEKARLFVSYICRIYDYVQILIIIMVLIFSIRLLNKPSVQYSTNSPEATVITINSENFLDIYSKDRIAFSEVLLELQKNNYSRILILSQKEIPSEIQQKIALFDRQKIYYLIDNTLSENEIKIIVEE